MSDWQKVVFAHDCQPCGMCGEPVCPRCVMHYADCNHPGPHQDDLYEYKEVDGVLYARKLDD